MSWMLMPSSELSGSMSGPAAMMKPCVCRACVPERSAKPLTALGIGYWLSALNVRFRDVRYVVPFLTQLWMFATPIVYLSSLLSEPWRTLFVLNPMSGGVEGFRWALLDADTQPGAMTAVSALVALTLFFTGLLFFRRTEAAFADVV